VKKFASYFLALDRKF